MTAQTVLYVDYSVGFGGSSKSLALTLSALPDIRKLLVTSQEPELVQELFHDIRTWEFRRRINYRSRMQLEERLRSYGWSRFLMFPALKLYAVLDLAVFALVVVKLFLIVKRNGVDLIHLNNGYFSREGIVAARLAGIPSLVHFRGFIRPSLPSWLLRWAPAADFTIAVSDAGVENLKAALPELRTVTVYDPVDVEAAAAAAGERWRVRKELGATDQDILVGIFGRVVHWKGQLEFVQATVEAMQMVPRLMAVIVGDISDGSEGYLRQIRAAIEASHYRDRFVMTGYRSDVAAYYAAIDIAVHASTSPEPFGMVIPEAMAAGRPVIATDAGGPREIVTHGVDGLRVPLGDVAALNAAILELARDPARRRDMGERAKQNAQRFAIENNAAAVRRVYEELLHTDRIRRTPDS